MFAEDLSTYFDVTDGFAVTATSGAASFPVIFDAAYLAALGNLVESTGPACLARTADVSALEQGSSITISSVAYTVVGVEPDGTGITLLRLRT